MDAGYLIVFDEERETYGLATQGLDRTSHASAAHGFPPRKGRAGWRSAPTA
jgi:hypothetical protein